MYLFACLFIYSSINSLIHSFNDILTLISVLKILLRPFMVQWVVGSIVILDPLTQLSSQPGLHDWCNKGRGIYYPVWVGWGGVVEYI